jgi:ABC-type Zn uptake system ZnuABC Zn-binding protein ZnuA
VSSFGQEKIVATASIMQDIVQNIAGSDIQVESIVPIGGDPHIYDPTPSDAALISQSKVIFINGLTFEGWLGKLIDNSGTSAEIVLMTKDIQPIESLKYKNSADPHAWMDVINAVKYAENAKDGLIRIYPEQKTEFEQNFKIYRDSLMELHEWVHNQIQRIPESHRYLVTSHDAFQYYGRQYGIELVALLGTTTDAEIQTSDVLRVNKIIKEKELPAIFIESTINPKLMKQLAQDNNVQIGGELFADSLSDKDGPASSYIKMIKHNTNTIVQALRSKNISDAKQTNDNSTKTLLYWLIPLLIMIFGLSIFFISRSKS